MSVVTRGQLKLTLVLATLLAFIGSAFAQTAGPPLPGGAIEPDFWRWAIIQGGLLLALVIVLWSYRKDLIGVIVVDAERAAMLIDLIKSSTAANEKSAGASLANEKAIDRLIRALEDMEKRIEGLEQ